MKPKKAGKKKGKKKKGDGDTGSIPTPEGTAGSVSGDVTAAMALTLSAENELIMAGQVVTRLPFH